MLVASIGFFLSLYFKPKNVFFFQSLFSKKEENNRKNLEMGKGKLFVTLAIICGLALIRRYLERKWGKCRCKGTMQRKTVIITGANSGIGKATATELAKRGARVIMACRDLNKAHMAIDDIRRVTQNGELKILHLDLSSLKSVRIFTDMFLATEDRLDILINNAGVFHCPYMLTEDGFEMQMGVNYLGHFLLTSLLLEKLKLSAPSRIVVVTSSLYKKGKINLEDLNLHFSYDRRKAYYNSKLAGIIFARELAKRLQNVGVNVYMVSPGMVWTNLGRYVQVNWIKILLLLPLAWVFIRTPTQGCQTIIHCAISEELEHESGQYYRNCRKESFVDITENETAKQLWNLSKSLTRLHSD